MFELKRSKYFDKWYNNIKEAKLKAIVVSRLERVEKGNFGDCEPVGDGIHELRIHYGKGHRIYFKETGKEIILLLCAGNKQNQSKTIKLAKKIINEA